ncbi:hypothetical protein D3C76_1865750 [compost metagenome]
MVVHLLQNYTIPDECLITVAEIIEHGIVVICEEQQIIPIRYTLDFKTMGIR